MAADGAKPDWVVEDAQRDIDASQAFNLALFGLVVGAICGGLVFAVPRGSTKLAIAAIGGGATFLIGVVKWARLKYFRGKVVPPADRSGELDQCRCYRFGGSGVLELRWQGQGIRIVLDGRELFQVPAEHAFESLDSYPMPDGTTLTIEWVPDFWKHRRLEVSRDGQALAALP